MSLVEYDRPPLQAPSIYIYFPYKYAVRVGIGPELGPCLSQRAGSDTIPTSHGIFIPAAEMQGQEMSDLMMVYSRLVFIDLW